MTPLEALAATVGGNDGGIRASDRDRYLRVRGIGEVSDVFTGQEGALRPSLVGGPYPMGGCLQGWSDCGKVGEGVGRADTKDELLASATAQFAKLLDLVTAMSADDQRSTFDFSAETVKKGAHWSRDKCLRDVLVHLYEWHRMLLAWVAANQAGESRPFLPVPHTWKTYGQLNVELWQRHQATPLPEAMGLLRASHDDVLALIQRFTDAELFEKAYFPWTGSSSLGSYCVSTTSSHYDWAIKKLRAHLGRLPQ